MFAGGRRELRELTTSGKAAGVAPITGYTEYKRKGSMNYTADFQFKAGRPVTIYYMPNLALGFFGRRQNG